MLVDPWTHVLQTLEDPSSCHAVDVGERRILRPLGRFEGQRGRPPGTIGPALPPLPKNAAPTRIVEAVTAVGFTTAAALASSMRCCPAKARALLRRLADEKLLERRPGSAWWPIARDGHGL